MTGRAIVPFEFSSEQSPLQNVHPPLHPTSSFSILSGRPGSGKTTALLNLLMRKQHYGGKFDAVYIISPSFGSVDSNLLASIPEDQQFRELTPEVLDEVLDSIYNKHQSQKVLIVLDDVVNDLAHNATQRSLQKLLFNRRHLTSVNPDAKKGGFVSVLMTTQVLNRIPLMLRKMANSVWLWPTRSQPELRAIRDELVPTEKSAFQEILKSAWRSKHDPLIVDVDGGDFWHINPAGHFEKLVSGDDMAFEQPDRGQTSAPPSLMPSVPEHAQFTDPLTLAHKEVLRRYKQMYG